MLQKVLDDPSHWKGSDRLKIKRGKMAKGFDMFKHIISAKGEFYKCISLNVQIVH